jgi:thiol-disulfide isomerase/thioredoxin
MSSRNSKGRFKPKPLLDVRKPNQILDLKQLILNGPNTFVLIYADWCGHCHRYMPKFKSLAKTPGRVANMATVNETVLKSIPELSEAKISGYPSVIKVDSNGKIEEYTVPGSSESTNVVPDMNDESVMRTLLTTAPSNSGSPGYQGPLAGNLHFMEKEEEEQRGGALASVFGAFSAAFNQVGPSALLLAAHELLPKSWKAKGGARRRNARRLTYKSPKRASHRSSTRKNRNRRG